MLFYTGMRSGELLALTPADILPTKRIDINKNFAKVKGEELFLEPKTPKARRCISIPDFLYDNIHEYISKLYGIGKGDRIFYFTKSALEKEIKRASDKAGLTPIRVHDLRHTHVTIFCCFSAFLHCFFLIFFNIYIIFLVFTVQIISK